MPVPAGALRTYLGTTKVSLTMAAAPLAIIDTPLAG
jgi:hypothetical protein